MVDPAIDRISRRIMNDAQAKSEQLVSEARAKASEIESRYESQGDERTAELRSRHEKEVAGLQNRLLAEARMTARRRVMDAKEGLLSETVEAALEKLGKLDNERHELYMEKAILEASAILGNKGLVAITAKRHEGTVKSAASRAGVKVSISSEHMECLGGAIIASGDGRAIDLTFDEALKRKRHEARNAAAEILIQAPEVVAEEPEPAEEEEADEDEGTEEAVEDDEAPAAKKSSRRKSSTRRRASSKRKASKSRTVKKGSKRSNKTTDIEKGSSSKGRSRK